MEKKRKYTFDFHQRWEKILLILRATLLVVVISTLNIEANASAQVIKVSLKMENATIDEMIKTIRTETNYRFLYRVEEVNKYGKRDIDLKNVSIEEFLKTALAGTNLSYEIEKQKSPGSSRERLPMTKVSPYREQRSCLKTRN